VRIPQENAPAGLFRQIGREQRRRAHTQNILAIIDETVIDPEVVRAWTLYESILKSMKQGRGG
jgi:hypothetical protein